VSKTHAVSGPCEPSVTVVTNDRITILFAGGGTGGHVFPGLALAAELLQLRPDLSIEWVGTRGRVEERAVPAEGYPLHFIDVSFLKGRRGLALLKAVVALPKAGVDAVSLVRRLSPVAVIGLGGFVSGPVCMAASLMNIPVFLLEQNARPGITNRSVSRIAEQIYATFRESSAWFPKSRLTIAGNPIRPALLRQVHRRAADLTRPVRILVVGGSQGARVLNQRMPALAKALSDAGVVAEYRHASGKGHEDATRAAWAAAGMEAQVDPFIDDMASAYAWADLLICRAGATTISELTALGIPALYVPFPQAADDHQTANARSVVDAGGGLMVTDAEFGNPACVDMVRGLLTSPTALNAMSEHAKALGQPDAGTRIAGDILQRLAHRRGI
jgi:UDP-N-acetylglucosamine--N-acetylmuramyl-(pentapeptide) pyrophosphoryl-undecaprenol N-acetylglucosamine transferase